MIWLLVVAAYLIGGTYLIHRDLVPRMVEAKYEDMDGYNHLYKDPEERLKGVKSAKTEALVISLGVGLFGLTPLYFAFQFLKSHSLASGPVCDRELQDRLAVREAYIEKLERDTGVTKSG